MVKIVWTSEALSWLREIHNHVAPASPIAAEKLVKGIISRVEQLESFPDSGAVISIAGLRKLRMLLYGHYRIVYRTTDGGIEIIGIYHGALEMARRLKRSLSDTIHE